MSFFAIVKTGASAQFLVQKLDINLWVLPGIFGRQVLLCDVGLRLKLLETITPERVAEFDLTLPFAADSQGLVDLVPIIREHEELFDLIFGNTLDISHLPVKVHGILMTAMVTCVLPLQKTRDVGSGWYREIKISRYGA